MGNHAIAEKILLVENIIGRKISFEEQKKNGNENKMWIRIAFWWRLAKDDNGPMIFYRKFLMQDYRWVSLINVDIASSHRQVNGCFVSIRFDSLCVPNECSNECCCGCRS